MTRRRARVRVPLFVLVTAPILLEIALVRRAGLPLVAALAPEVTAVPPFALLHDLRWLGVYESSPSIFVVA